MSQNYLTKSEAAAKIGASGLSGNDFVTKADLAACGNADMSKLAGYQDNWYVVDDDIQIGKCYICNSETDKNPLATLTIKRGTTVRVWLSIPINELIFICKMGSTPIGMTQTQPDGTGNPAATVPLLFFSGNVRYFDLISRTDPMLNFTFIFKNIECNFVVTIEK